MNEDADLVFCPLCKNEIATKLLGDATNYINLRLYLMHKGECPICHERMPVYMQSDNDQSLLLLRFSDLLYCISDEIRSSTYSGRLGKSEPLSALDEPLSFDPTSAGPSHIVLFICSAIASGVIGNLAYDLIKARLMDALGIWKSEIKQKYGEYNHPDGFRIVIGWQAIGLEDEEDTEAAIKAIYDYCRQRLRGIDTLDCTREPYMTAISVLKTKDECSPEELAMQSKCSIIQAERLLKAVGENNNSLW